MLGEFGQLLGALRSEHHATADRFGRGFSVIHLLLFVLFKILGGEFEILCSLQQAGVYAEDTVLESYLERPG